MIVNISILPAFNITKKCKFIVFQSIFLISGTFSAVKRKVLINTVPVDICQLFYKIKNESLPSILCVGGRTGHDTCSGDSGGPLMQAVHENKKSNWILYGVISYGSAQCGREGQPAVYTRITHYLDWVIQNLK